MNFKIILSGTCQIKLKLCFSVEIYVVSHFLAFFALNVLFNL